MCWLILTASCFDPQVSVMKDRKFENPQTANLSRVLTDSYEIRQLLVNITVDLNNSTDLTVSAWKKGPFVLRFSSSPRFLDLII